MRAPVSAGPARNGSSTDRTIHGATRSLGLGLRAPPRCWRDGMKIRWRWLGNVLGCTAVLAACGAPAAAPAGPAQGNTSGGAASGATTGGAGGATATGAPAAGAAAGSLQALIDGARQE